jgi:flagellar biosynthesis/type III secretory pathway protein FliH
MPAKKVKAVKAPKVTKTTKAAKTAKTTKPVKTTKAPQTAKALQDARESNRLRQQRFLEKHRDEINEKRRERYAKRKESGCCPRCGKKLRSLKLSLCKSCLEKAREYNQQ